MDSSADVPDLVPARMMNEFTYCPRLFYLEWVQARFVESVDTLEGTYQHRNVDRPTGDAPLPEEGPLAESGARSVMVSSPELGLVGRIDLLEGDVDTVVPLDYKHGSAPDTAERSWEPERVQLCTLGLMLRDAGYQCDRGILYFVGSRERVDVPFTDELVARTLAQIGSSVPWRREISPRLHSFIARSARGALWSASACRTSTTCSWPGVLARPAGWFHERLKADRCM